MTDNLDTLYAEAQSALKRKEYDRAAELLTQIIAVDENYKDVSRLLAQTVRLKRRRWYGHPALRTVVIVAAVIGLGMWILPRLQTQPAQETSAPVVLPTSSSTAAIAPTQTSAPTITPSPTPTAIPLKWRRISMGQDFARDEIAVIAQDARDKDLIYVRTKNSGVYHTLDGGASWQPSNEVMPSGGNNGSNPDLRLPGKCSILAVNPQDNRFAYCVIEIGIYRTHDSGANWQLSNPHVEWIKSLLISPHDPQVIFAGGQGLSVSRDGGQNWELINNGLPNIPMQIMVSPQDSTVLFAQEYINNGAPTGFPVYRSADSGQTWKQVLKYNCVLMFEGNGHPVCGGVSLDNGATWRSAYQGGPLLYDKMYGATIALGANFPYSSTVIIRNSDWWDAEGFFVSQDKGATWRKLNNLLDEGADRDQFYFDHQQGQVIYSVALEGGEIPLLHRSDDFGETWERCSAPGFGGPEITSPDTNTRLAVAYNDRNRIYLATRGQGVFISNDGCMKWQKSAAGLTNLYVNTVIATPENPNILYVGTDGGAFVSHDSGATWGQVNDGLLGATVIYSIAVDREGKVFAATPYGVFTLEKK